MPLVALGVVLLLPVLAVALLPLALLQRYRAGRARRRARGWLAALNVAAFTASVTLFLLASAVTSLWITGAFSHALLGVAAGGALGILGLILSRWEHANGGLHFTPNRWLVLAITLVVAGRIGYGAWRAFHAWQTAGEHWVQSAGVAGSLAAGGLVLGYSLAYWAGVRRRIRAGEGSWSPRPPAVRT